MPQYICTTAIGKYEKGNIIQERKYKKLSEAEKLYFKPYNPDEEFDINYAVEDMLHKDVDD